ncbi:DUF5305 family protein [Neobacillus drentensis]|uniref:DUF5305 family protein n=1 Tax=Neobacillus drentensis TaxID=220684 RepID=UPI00285B59F0|nr:DUF5305 family protein [Neobacillus drentensis]MDR7239076.1 hypothetical protein [Neobacillus drentensis]
MTVSISNKLKRNSKKFYRIIILLLVISTAFTIYTFLQPATTTTQVNDNTSRIETGYDYKADITPNILYPNGGSVEVGNSIFKKITVAIPFDIKSTIYSEREVTTTGTYEVQLLIKAGDLWERKFPLGQKQSFEKSGTEISIIEDTYKIDLEKVNSFIMQVEQETGINPSQYTLEILPNIKGTIHDAGVKKNFQIQDRLIFQYSMDEILLASEKSFTSMITFASSHVMTKIITVFSQDLPLSFVRISSLLFSIILLATYIYVNKKSKENSTTTNKSEVEIINKRYANRILPVSQKINIVQKSIFVLDSFKSVIKIADEKELPIFFSQDQKEENSVYFIVDGDYLYTYETGKTTDTEKKASSGNAYARG